MSHFLSRTLIRTSNLLSLLLLLSLTSTAQFTPATPPIADPSDTRFHDVYEDRTTPSLATTHLMPVHPLIAFTDEHPTYTIQLLQLQWRWGDPIDLYVIKPKGVKNPPVILYLYGYPSKTDVFRNDDFDQLVTKNGCAAVGFVSALTGHRYHDRPLKEWFLSELPEALTTSAHDVQMVLTYLATRGDLDMDRVGMFTHGSGATIAILASAVDPRIKVLEALDPWGDWPTWIATSPFVPENERAEYVKPEFLKKIGGLDTLEWLPRIQAKTFRLDQELFDTVTPKPAREKMRVAAPANSSTLLYKDMDEFKAAFEAGKNLQWIQHELQSIPAPSASSTPLPTPSH